MAKKRIVPVEFKLKGDKDLKQFNKSLRSMDTSLKKSTKSLKTMESTSKKVAGSLKLLGAAVAGMVLKQGFQKLTSVIMEFERTMAQLETLEGSADGATRAFEKIQKFAETTPFTLDQTTAAFIKLKNLGLDPSEAAMTSYGNTAAAMGRNISEFANAVGAAVTGEMEMLKGYGVVAKQQGDKVTFIFRGVETTVAKTSSEIQGYLQSLGNVEFAGSMERQAKGIGVAFSNLGTAYDDLFRLKPEDGVDGLSESVTDLTGVLSDPQFKESFQSLISGMLSLATLAGSAAAGVKTLAESAAAMASGIAADDIERLLAEQKRLEQAISADRFWSDTEELQSELNVVNKQIAAYRTLGELKNDTVIPITSGNDAPATSSSGVSAAPVVTEEIQKGASAMALAAVAANDYKQMMIGVAKGQADWAAQFEETTVAVNEFEQVIVDGLTSNLDTMFDGVLQGTQSLSDGFKDMAKVIIAELLKIAAYKTIMSAFGGTDFGASFGASSGATPWASGGIVKGPMMASGNNLIGEAGPEGLLPLTRNSKGDLSVSTDGGGGGGMNVTVNNNAPGVSVNTASDGNGGLTIEIIEQAIAGRIAQGGNAISDSMQNSFGLSRGLGAR